MSAANDHARHVRTATRFFWAWLAGSFGASVAYNIAHAVLNSYGTDVVISASAAVIPPTVAICATHGVRLLVKAEVTGLAYRVALVGTSLMALGALTLSFNALRDLAAKHAGYSSWTSWVWPLVIDLAIAVSTVALLALGSARRTERTGSVHTSAPVHTEHNGVPAHLARAEALVAEGAVTIEAERVAQVLQELDAGTPPGTIARTLRMGYATVVRIRDADQSRLTSIGG
ncbi:hypothetical protein SEA_PHRAPPUCCINO_29 [Mycobacterium phage Phrappuccino]|uniref:DUF2637 domain-containing protein n=1 Tax=Mycobacterium phage Phrappuccino TaxID=2591223 RepID=A0A514DDM4_9CAUD|nr:hypothetical protein KHQ87_gp029 [Mycobacterium phage Phrappuccino]QDH91707.1 hypothetical protein SEA_PHRAPPUCCINO_29 [Mycobacterium phage Phrappuccino]QIQ63151.1 hypothetical protein SEA_SETTECANDELA_29 [Mycobacterium phage Settecandela]